MKYYQKLPDRPYAELRRLQEAIDNDIFYCANKKAKRDLALTAAKHELEELMKGEGL